MSYLNARQVATALGISRSRVYRLARTRKVGRLVMGRRCFLQADIERLRPQEKYRRKVGAGK